MTSKRYESDGVMLSPADEAVVARPGEPAGTRAASLPPVPRAGQSFPGPACESDRAHTTTAHFFSSVPLQRTRARSCRATRAPRDARSPSRAAEHAAGGNATRGRRRDPRLLAHAALPCPGLRAEPPEKADMGQKSTSRRRMTLVFDRRRPGEPPGPCRIEKRDRPEISFRRLFGTSAYAFGRSLHAPCMLTRPRVGGVPLPFGAGVDAHAAGALGAALGV